MFENSNNIIKLGKANFRNDHFNHDKDLFIMLYSPMCPHCIRKEDNWTNLSNIPNLGNNLDVAACDVSQEREIGNSLGINGVPSFKYQSNDKLYDIPQEIISELIILLNEPINTEMKPKINVSNPKYNRDDINKPNFNPDKPKYKPNFNPDKPKYNAMIKHETKSKSKHETKSKSKSKSKHEIKSKSKSKSKSNNDSINKAKLNQSSLFFKDHENKFADVNLDMLSNIDHPNKPKPQWLENETN